MKAISLHQPWASYIADGLKTIETRTRPTRFRGELLICSTKKISKGRPASFRKLPYGKAIAIVEVYGCRRMVKGDVEAAMYPWSADRWSWLLKNIRPIEPFPIKGSQGFYEVEYPKGTLIPKAGSSSSTEDVADSEIANIG